MTQAERLAVVEQQITQLREAFDEHKQDVHNELVEAAKARKEMSNKLDSILELKHKGAGAFWFASALFGTGMIGFIMSFIDWFRGT